jgi:hypothetical protein
MNKTKRIALGIGIVLAVLAAFTAPAMAGPNTIYFTNWTHTTNGGGSSEESEITYVELWVNVTDSYGTQEDFALGALGINVTFNSSIGEITACNEPGGHPWDDDWWATKHGDSWFLTISYKCWDHPGPPFGLGPGVYPIANYTIEGTNTGVMDLAFNFETPRMCAMCDCIGDPYPNQTWEDGKYHCGHVLNLDDFPMYESEAVGTPPDHKNGSGPAVSKMWLDYLHNSTTQWNDTSFGDMPAKDQAELYDWGIANNSNPDLPYFDTQGMWHTVQYLDPTYSLYGYNFGKYSSTDQDYMIRQICRWIDYAPGDMPGHPVHVPGAVPAYGNYENWMAIRGIHTNVSAYPLPAGLEVYGFWVNDPYPASLGGIGENSFKMVEDWKTTYYLPLATGDDWDGKYVGILEPPGDDDGEITIVPAKPRFADVITPALADEPMMLYGIEQLALEKVVNDDESLKIVKAAIDGVNEGLVPYDDNFAAVFAKTVPGKPKLVTSDNGDYYVVPFNVPVVERPPVKIMPVEIERVKVSGLRKLERVKKVAANAVIEPIVIEPITVERTLVVVLVNAEDGSFKEASWVADPVEYLPVSKMEAMKLALGEVLDELNIVVMYDAKDLEVIQQRPTIELVYVDASPYYPDWKVTVNGEVFYVSQDGTVSS